MTSLKRPGEIEAGARGAYPRRAYLVAMGDTAASQSTDALSARNDLVVRVIQDLAAFAAVEEPWNALANRTRAFPMARHEWLLCDARAAGCDELAVFTAWRGSQLCAALPLAVTRSGGVRRLVWLSSQMVEPETILHDDADALDAVWRAARSYGLPIFIRRLELPADALGRIEHTQPRRGHLVLRRATTQTVAAAVRDWTSFDRAMSGSSRSEMRRKRSGLAKHGAVEFHAVCPTPTEVDGYLDELLRVEAAGWKSRTQTAIAYRPVLAAFLRGYARRTAELGTLRLFFLSLAGENIAAQLLVEVDRRLWQFKIGYDERWAKYSPGRLLMFDILKWASTQGLEKVEYLGLGGGWQTRWPAEITPQHTLRFYPYTLNSGIAFAVDTVQFIIRKLRKEKAGEPPERGEPSTAGSA